MSRSLVITVSLAACLAFTLAGCKRTSTGQWPDTPGPKVAVSFAPLYCFTINVSGERGSVRSVLSTQGPHHADTSIQERILLEEADLFLFNGLGLDDAFAGKLKLSTSNKSLKMVDLGAKLEADKATHGLLLGSDGCGCCKPGEDDAGHAHDHDPHLWLSPVLAGKMVDEIRYVLRGAEPNQKELFDRNAAEYQLKLKAILDDGKKLLKDKKERAFVSTHGSLQYFARDFDLVIAGSLQATPGQEPSPADLKKLIEKCVKDKVRVIAVEPQYASHQSPKQLKAELEAAGIQDVVIVELDPLETATATELTPDWYERKMRANLENLAKVLK
jgi:zinc transport system substrate-binding protein